MLPDCKLFCIRLSLAWSRSWKMVRCALQVELLSPSRRLGFAIHRQFSTYFQHTQKSDYFQNLLQTWAGTKIQMYISNFTTHRLQDFKPKAFVGLSKENNKAEWKGSAFLFYCLLAEVPLCCFQFSCILRHVFI